MHGSVRMRKRVALLGGLAAFVVFIVFPVLALTTPVIDGTFDGISVGYVVGLVEFAIATAAAAVYCRWANRVEGVDGEER